MRYIPKIIHIVWFGKGPYGIVEKRCVDSWGKHCPDYKIMIWNEESFDIGISDFTKEAYENRRWAFVSDYVRLYALYHYGGVYADTDVEILKNFDSILENEHFVTGYSTPRWVPSGFMAAEKGNALVKRLLDYYKDRHFCLEDGTLDMRPNNAIITEILINECGFTPGNMHVDMGNVRLYPRAYFEPIKRRAFAYTKENMENAGKYFLIDPEKTYCIHYGVGSWVTEDEKQFSTVKKYVRRLLPQKIVDALVNHYYKKHYGV